MTGHPAAWHERRREGIGSSDIAGILGISPWATPYSVWADKVAGAGPDSNGSERMRWGSLLEGEVIAEAARRLGVTVTGRQVYAAHPEHPWARAELDAEWADADGVAGALEAKTSGERWRAVPVHYEAQVQWQLEIRDMDAGWVACLHSGQHLTLWRVARDRAIGAGLLEVAERFWTRHVLAWTPPPIDGAAVTGEAIGRVNAAVPELAADAGPIAGLLVQLGELRAAQRAAKSMAAHVENQIRSYLGPATVGLIDGAPAVTWRPQAARRIDTDRLRDEQPVLAEQYTVYTPSRPLRLPGAKGDD
jgi:putative phage-type endonuclease